VNEHAEARPFGQGGGIYIEKMPEGGAFERLDSRRRMVCFNAFDKSAADALFAKCKGNGLA
jgi:hypothetical protein